MVMENGHVEKGNLQMGSNESCCRMPISKYQGEANWAVCKTRNAVPSYCLATNRIRSSWMMIILDVLIIFNLYNHQTSIMYRYMTICLMVNPGNPLQIMETPYKYEYKYIYIYKSWATLPIMVLIRMKQRMNQGKMHTDLLCRVTAPLSLWGWGVYPLVGKLIR